MPDSFLWVQRIPAQVLILAEKALHPLSTSPAYSSGTFLRLQGRFWCLFSVHSTCPQWPSPNHPRPSLLHLGSRLSSSSTCLFYAAHLKKTATATTAPVPCPTQTQRYSSAVPTAHEFALPIQQAWALIFDGHFLNPSLINNQATSLSGWSLQNKQNPGKNVRPQNSLQVKQGEREREETFPSSEHEQILLSNTRVNEWKLSACACVCDIGRYLRTL